MAAGASGTLLKPFESQEVLDALEGMPDRDEAFVELEEEAVVEGAPFYQGDVGDGKLVERIVRECEVESCVHFAAFAYVGESVTQPELYFENNVIQGIQLLGK